MKAKKRVLSLLLCGALLFSGPPAAAFAEGAEYGGAAGLCEHHPAHDESCGYTEASGETPCSHEHMDECYTSVTICIHEHTPECYPATESESDDTDIPSGAGMTEPTGCTHVCSEESGCVKKELNCRHEHKVNGGEADSECGYAPAVQGTPCTYVCEVCHPQDIGSDFGSGAQTPEEDEQPENPEPGGDACVCAGLCQEENVNLDCPVCSADWTLCKGTETSDPSDAAQFFDGNVQKLIDELPTADELRNMTAEEQQAVYEKLQTAYDAYNALTDEEKAEITGAEIFDSLFDVFNGMANALANKTNYNISEGAVTIDDSCGNNCSSHTITGSSSTNTITVTGGTHNIILNNVNIDVSSTSTSPFFIENNATVNLTLVGTSTLKGGNDRAGLQLSEEASLIITKESDGNTLNAIGGWMWGAGIGGWYSSSGGNITINGGNINAATASSNNGGNGAAIGGGRGEFKGHVTINGGKVNAEARNGSGIGGGNAGTGTFEAGGNAVIFAYSYVSNISDNSDTSDWNGVIFQDKSGKVYAANSNKTITIDISFEIPSKYTLEIPEGITLAIPEGVTINNLGSLENNGTIDLRQGGKITGNPPTGSGTILYPKAPTPTVTIAGTTASSITVKELENKDTYGGAEYSLDRANWQTGNVFRDLPSSTKYTVYARYKGNYTSHAQSDEGKTENVSTSPANYTITIPAAPIEAGNSESKAELKPSESFDVGYGGTATVKVKENSGVDNDGNLNLIRQNDTENHTITSALLVNGSTLGNISNNVAMFKTKTDTPVMISFAEPTETNILAGTYKGTITFVVSYSE